MDFQKDLWVKVGGKEVYYIVNWKLYYIYDQFFLFVL